MEDQWAGMSPHTPTVSTHGKSHWQENSGLGCGAVARWLPCHLVIVAGRILLAPQCGKYLASGSVQLSIPCCDPEATVSFFCTR